MNRHFIGDVLIVGNGLIAQRQVSGIASELPAKRIEANLYGFFVASGGVDYHDPINFIVVCHYGNVDISAVEFSGEYIAVMGKVSIPFGLELADHFGFAALDRDSRKRVTSFCACRGIEHMNTSARVSSLFIVSFLSSSCHKDRL